MNITDTPHYNAWAGNIERAGNRLDLFEPMWRFDVDSEYPLAWAARTQIHVITEDRTKEEFVLSRPDISHVVAIRYDWESPLDSEVVLVREFRCTARTPSGFIFETPGGSSFKGQNPLQDAADDFFQETGLRVDADRFEALSSKQVCGTFSTHKAHVFLVELTDEEMATVAANDTQGNEEETERTHPLVLPVLSILDNDVDWSNTGMVLQALNALGNR